MLVIDRVSRVVVIGCAAPAQRPQNNRSSAAIEVSAHYLKRA
jgi:hypothetical protein